jgi:hypothetical protein
MFQHARSSHTIHGFVEAEIRYDEGRALRIGLDASYAANNAESGALPNLPLASVEYEVLEIQTGAWMPHT